MKSTEIYTITGSNGFLGKNLIESMNGEYDVRALSRTDSDERLFNAIQEASVLFHFAGEVRPSADEKEFSSNNVELTKRIAEYSKHSQIRKIVYASSIHAASPKNTYGITKRLSEEVLEKLSQESPISVDIYRLPHIFGRHLRPNHNSAIGTWIHNALTGKELKVYDKNIELRYAYAGDVTQEMLYNLCQPANTAFMLREPSITHLIKLGTLACFIETYVSTGEIIDVDDHSLATKLIDSIEHHRENLAK